MLLVVDMKAQSVELWRLYRTRNLELPPFQRAWWQVTRGYGRGVLAAELLLCAWGALGEMGFSWIYLGALVGLKIGLAPASATS
jgi:hypothetical protein